MPDEPGQELETRRLPQSLWERLRRDPRRAAEHIALAAAERHGPAAAAWSTQKRALYAYSSRQLAEMAKRSHARLARVGGVATGVGGAFTVLPDLAALAWIQSRLVFFIAAAYGHDPNDPMRAAELLYLQGLYPDPASARQALDGAGTPLVAAYVGARGGDAQLQMLLLKFVGMRAAERFGGRAIPFVASAINAVGNERDTRALADRAIAFYGGELVDG